MLNEKITACMLGESVFKVGDKTSLVYGWNKYKNMVSITDIINLRIIDMYCIFEENSCFPKFKVTVKTLTDKNLEVDVMDLKDVRSIEENHVELKKLGYDFSKGCLYSKGYETCDGKWKFYHISINEGRKVNIQVI